MDWLIPIACLVAGIVAGWFLRRGTSPPSLRVIEEMYSRKARLAEKDRDGAIQELNANRVEMTTFAERFEGLDRRIADLGAELARARSAKQTVEGEVERREDELAALREELAEACREESLARILFADAQEENERVGAAQDRAEEEAQGHRAEAGRLQKRVAELETSARALTSELEARARARTAAESEAAALRAELAHTQSSLARLGEELAGLSGLPAEIEAARAALTRGAEELDATTTQCEQTHTALESLQAEHRSLAAELSARARELLEARDELTRIVPELGAARAQCERLEGECTGLVEANTQLASARDALAQRVEELARVLDEREAELLASTALLRELDPLPAELARVGQELAERERLHGSASLELERAWKERSESMLLVKDSALGEERRRSEERAQRLEELGLELQRTHARLRELEERSAAQSTEGLELSAEHERLERELEATKGARLQAEAQLGERAGRIAELEGVLRGKDFQIRELPRLSRELEQARAKALELQRNLVEVQGRVRELETGAKARERETSELRRELARQEKELRATEAAREKALAQFQEGTEHLQELEGELRQKNGLVRDLEAQLRRSPAAKDTLQPVPRKPNERDDLKRIAGIGPVLEKKLVRLGYRTYRQIAALKKEEIEALAERLGTSAERIRREGWLASAREAMRSNGT